MSFSSHPNGSLPPSRRLRLDVWRGRSWLGPWHSGRKLVVGGALALLIVSGLISWAFRTWEARYQALAAFGREEVAPTVDPLVNLEPPGVDRATWRQAVADTHELVRVVTASGLLNREQMESLKRDLRGRVARTTATTAVTELRGIWDDLERSAGPIVLRKPERPPYPPRRPVLLVPAAPDSKAQARPEGR